MAQSSEKGLQTPMKKDLEPTEILFVRAYSFSVEEARRFLGHMYGCEPEEVTIEQVMEHVRDDGDELLNHNSRPSLIEVVRQKDSMGIPNDIYQVRFGKNTVSSRQILEGFLI